MSKMSCLKIFLIADVYMFPWSIADNFKFAVPVITSTSYWQVLVTVPDVQKTMQQSRDSFIFNISIAFCGM
jgi:hypothetical protein